MESHFISIVSDTKDITVIENWVNGSVLNHYNSVVGGIENDKCNIKEKVRLVQECKLFNETL